MSRSDAGSYRAVIQNGYNAEDPLSTLELVSKPIPTAAAGEIVVHITLRPVNPTDLIGIRTGRTAKGQQTPVSPGSEGFGVVKSIGEGVTLVKPGQRVIPLNAPGKGSWQEYVSLKEELVIPIPDSISDDVAAQIVVNPATVIGMLDDLAVPKGEYLLQTAAGSVLGRQLIQLAKHLGIKTINIVRRPEQKEELLALGADEVLCSKTEDIVARVKEITSDTLAYGAVECVGGDLTKTVATSVRSEGQVFIYGILGSTEVVIGSFDLFRGLTVKAWRLASKSNELGDLIKQAIKFYEDKVWEPLIGEKFDLADFKEAIEKSESVGRGGKIFLTSP